MEIDTSLTPLAMLPTESCCCIADGTAASSLVIEKGQQPAPVDGAAPGEAANMEIDTSDVATAAPGEAAGGSAATKTLAWLCIADGTAASSLGDGTAPGEAASSKPMEIDTADVVAAATGEAAGGSAAMTEPSLCTADGTAASSLMMEQVEQPPGDAAKQLKAKASKKRNKQCAAGPAMPAMPEIGHQHFDRVRYQGCMVHCGEVTVVDVILEAKNGGMGHSPTGSSVGAEEGPMGHYAIKLCKGADSGVFAWLKGIPVLHDGMCDRDEARTLELDDPSVDKSTIVAVTFFRRMLNQVTTQIGNHPVTFSDFTVVKKCPIVFRDTPVYLLQRPGLQVCWGLVQHLGGPPS
jgi:hypothetical protein